MSLTFETKQVKINGSQTSILLQNENGPCALIALSNVLLLSPKHSNQVAELQNLVQSPKVSLQDLVTSLANIAVRSGDATYADTDHLLKLLPQLHTGLLVNPAFNGSFRDAPEMALFRLFQVSLVHGWLVDPQQYPQCYERLSRYSYDDAQKLLVQAYELRQNGDLSEKDREVVMDADYLRSFLARSATQLTNYGLEHLNQIILEGSYAVFFRNDHFATIYKRNGELFTLVTDLGYKYRSDIVWQSLNHVNGTDDTFYTGDVIPTPLDRPEDEDLSPNPKSAPLNPFATDADSSSDVVIPPDSAFMTDEELARRLQEEEDGRMARIAQDSYNPARTARKRRTNARQKDALEEKLGSSTGQRKKKKKKLFKMCIVM